MLILSRKADESIIIGDDIVVTIVRIQGDKVRLGIEAPRDVTVHRKEVYEAIQQGREAASRHDPPEASSLGNGAPPVRRHRGRRQQ